jgi:Family of unknown function (DUF5317)
MLKGSVRHLERVRLHWWGLAAAGFVIQASPVGQVPGLSVRGSGAVTLITSYVLLLIFLALNRRIPAASVMAVGLLLNLLVVGVNAGMPVSAGAIEVAGGTASTESFEGPKHHLMTTEDRLQFLGDVIPVPSPFGVVISIGDVLLYGGLAWLAFRATRGRTAGNPRPLAMWFPSYRGKHAPEHWRLAARTRAIPRAAVGRPGTEP